jgi:DNA-binding MarR family transcriptional regulator
LLIVAEHEGSKLMTGEMPLLSRKKGKPPSLSKANYEALAEFRFAIRKFMAFSEEAANAAGLKPQQHQALLAIKGAHARDALSIGEIAERLLVRHHTAVELVDRLTALGLVTRESDLKDARRMLVSLTKKGHHAINELSAIHLNELRSIRPTLEELLEQFEKRDFSRRRSR